MKDPRIDLRSPAFAAVMAFLLPGAGHLYQGRRLKAGIYAVCILGTFFFGMILGDWQPVYSQVIETSHPYTPVQLRESVPPTRWSIGYAAQVLVGLPAVPALIQQERFRNGDGPGRAIAEPIDARFQGIFSTSRQDGESLTMPVKGRLQLTPENNGLVTGSFDGTDRHGDSVAVDIMGGVEIGRSVFGSPERLMRCVIFAKEPDGRQQELYGTIPRPFLDWYQAPRDDAELDRLHGKLSQKFDLALVFTWIAGLLNLMAVWDAFDGPAYGYGDEKPGSRDDKDARKDKDAPRNP